MKKFITIIMAAMFTLTVFTACSKTESEVDSDTPEINRNITYSVNDFAIYTTDDELLPSKFITMLGLDPTTVEESTDETLTNVKNFIESETMEIVTGDINNPGQTIRGNVVRYFKYTGSRYPITNPKGITTTGIMPEDDNCSTAEDVIEAYGIDTENEEYKENEMEDGSYTIRLSFKDLKVQEGTVERIIIPKGSDIAPVEARYTLRFNIINDHVHGIDGYMYY